jgi:hypothetical protein
MKLRLPAVTLVMIDATCPELSRLSLADSLAQVECGDVIVCSPEWLAGEDERWVQTPKWNDRLGCSKFIW